MYSNYYENSLDCKLKNYSSDSVKAFFEKISCGDYSELVIFLLFTILLTLFVMTLNNKKN